MPQFIAADRAVMPQLWILGATFVVLATLGATTYALFAATIRGLLRRRRAQQAYGLLGGGLLCGAGIWALGARRAVENA